MVGLHLFKLCPALKYQYSACFHASAKEKPQGDSIESLSVIRDRIHLSRNCSNPRELFAGAANSLPPAKLRDRGYGLDSSGDGISLPLDSFMRTPTAGTMLTLADSRGYMKVMVLRLCSLNAIR